MGSKGAPRGATALPWRAVVQKTIVGCGYLGRRVAGAWIEQGHRVAALTRSRRHADEFRARQIEAIIGAIRMVKPTVFITDEVTASSVLKAVGVPSPHPAR